MLRLEIVTTSSKKDPNDRNQYLKIVMVTRQQNGSQHEMRRRAEYLPRGEKIIVPGHQVTFYHSTAINDPRSIFRCILVPF